MLDSYDKSIVISNDEFEIFKHTNEKIMLKSGQHPAFEGSKDMIDSYLMLAPDGRVIKNTNNKYTYHPIESISSNLSKLVNEKSYISRGGKYD